MFKKMRGIIVKSPTFKGKFSNNPNNFAFQKLEFLQLYTLFLKICDFTLTKFKLLLLYRSINKLMVLSPLANLKGLKCN